MSWPRLPWRLAAWLGLILLVVVAMGVGRVQLEGNRYVAAIEGQSLDWRFRLRGPMEPSGEVAVVLIDDASVAAAGQWPLPRAVLAAMVDRLTDAGAAAIALDLLMLDAAHGDDALIRALHHSGRVVLAAAMTLERPRPLDGRARAIVERDALKAVRETVGTRLDGLYASGVLLPAANLADAAATGHVNVFLEPDGSLRAVHPSLPLDGLELPALPVQLARLMLKLEPSRLAIDKGASLTLGRLNLPLDQDSQLVVNFYGPTGTMPTYTAEALLAGRVPASALAGKAVIIGAAATGVRDSFATPFHPNLPGAELFATLTDNILSERMIDRSGLAGELDLLLILATGVLAGLLVLPMPRLAFAAAGLVLLLLPLAVAIIAFARFDLWLSMVFPPACGLIVLAAATVVRGTRSLRRILAGEAGRERLGRYVSPLLRQQLGEGRPVDAADRTQPAAILFVDMRGFTAASEALGPEAAQGLLRHFHRFVEAAAVAERGVLSAYLGDGAMVVFGLPEPALDDSIRALIAARAMLDAAGRWRAELEAEGKPSLGVGIGIHFGPVRTGHIGGADQLHFTATGDTVNVAARLQASTRDMGVSLLISSAAVDMIRASGREDLLAGTKDCGLIGVRGRKAPVTVWALAEASAPT